MATKPFLSQIAVPVGTTTGDVYYPQTSLLMHFNGTNGSTTMTDSSKNNLAVTATNGAAISTAQSKFGGSSVFFDGTNDFLSISNNAEFNFVTGTFTVELWAYFSSVSDQRPLVTNYQNSTNGWAVQLYLGKIFASFSGDGIDIQGTTTILTNTWHHIAVSGTPGSYKLFLNGVQEGPTYTGGTTLTSTSALTIGQIASSAYFNGYIDELRITTGIARYTSNFTPSTTQFLDSTGDANSNVVVNSTATGFAIGTGGINGAQLAKAWVNFNGTGTVAIRDSYNVSSITDNSTGNYTVNYSTAFSNANYCVNASARNFSVIAASGGSITTTGVTVNTNNASMTSEDTSYVFVSIFSN
jgi:hypothetical protein